MCGTIATEVPTDHRFEAFKQRTPRSALAAGAKLGIGFASRQPPRAHSTSYQATREGPAPARRFLHPVRPNGVRRSPRPKFRWLMCSGRFERREVGQGRREDVGVKAHSLKEGAEVPHHKLAVGYPSNRTHWLSMGVWRAVVPGWLGCRGLRAVGGVAWPRVGGWR
jgi:hypothetical protein